MKHNQQGAALIAVLLFLILITVAGAIALRQGSTDLKVATIDQANALMFNSSDSVLANIERASGLASANSSDSTLKSLHLTIMSPSQGVLGYFVMDAENKIGEQISFCYRPSNTQMYNIGQAIRWKPGNDQPQGGITRACNPNEPNDYGSDRGTVMTQVTTVSLPVESQSTDNFGAMQEGELASLGETAVNPRVSIHATSVLPALSTHKDDEIQTCLSRPVGTTPQDYGTNVKNIASCLHNNAVPHTEVVEEGLMRLRKDVVCGGPGKPACAASHLANI